MRNQRYLFLTAVLLFLSMTVRAQFNPSNPSEPQTYKAYALTLQADPAEAATLTGAGRYQSGKTVTVSATSTDARWKFINWTDDEGTVKSTNASFSYKTTSSPVTFTAHYEEVATSSILLSANYAAGGNLTGDGTYAVGTKVTVKATVNSSFAFVKWVDAAGEVVSTTASFSYTTTEDDVHLTAIYNYTPSNPADPSPTKAKHRFYFTANPSGAGTFNKTSGNDLVMEGNTYSITASANTNWTFINWTDAVTGQVLSTSRSTTFTMGTSDAHLVANYEFKPSNPNEPLSDSRKHCTLYGFDHSFYSGQTTLYPIYLENTMPVTALTFSLLVPNTLVVSDACTTLRSSRYTIGVSVDSISEDITRFTYSLTGGSQFADNNGKVMEIGLSSAEGVNEGSFRLTFEEGTATTADGNVSLTFRDGFAHVMADESDLLASFTNDQYMNRVQFTNQSLHSRSVEWNFGDGSVDTIPNPMHIYAEPGTYHVSLTAYGALTQNIAEKVIVINSPSTWTAEGDFTLDKNGHAARNFTSLDEMVTLMSQCKITGDISVDVMNDTYYSYAAVDSASLADLEKLTLALASHTIRCVAANEDAVTLSFLTDRSVEAEAAVFALLTHLKGEGVTFLMDGVEVDASVLSENVSQTVLTHTASVPVPFSSACADESFSVRWSLLTASSAVSGYETAGTGDLPAMTLVTSTRTQSTVIYDVVLTLGQTELYSGIYTLYVNPVPTVDNADMEALKTLYEATGGASWTNKWNIDDATISGNWTGVTFDADGHVTDISLASNNLSGSLPTAGFVLPFLKTLNLSTNGLSGDIAAFIANLPLLTTLNLSRNKFTTLDTALPSTLTKVDLGYQYANFAGTDLPSQTLALNGTMAIDLGTLLGYDHAHQTFDAHPQLSIYTETDNNYVGRLNYSDDAYHLTLNGNYRLPSGAAVRLVAQSGVADGSYLRAALTYAMGDANVDSQVDVLDAQHTINRILLRSNGLFNEQAADTYTDQMINVQDVVCTVNIILGQEPSNEAYSVQHRQMTDEANSDDVILYVNENGLQLESTSPVAALDLTFTGVRSTDIRLLLPRSRWQMMAQDTPDGVRLVILSPAGNVLSDSASTLLALPEGATLTHAMISNVEAQAMKTRIGTSTALLPIEVEADEMEIFDLSGRRMTGYPTESGIYFINGKKMIVK